MYQKIIKKRCINNCQSIQLARIKDITHMDNATINDKSNKKRAITMKKIFVTGINGLLGTNLVNDLLDKDFIVKGLVRDKKKFKGNKHNNLELIQDNLFSNFTTVLRDMDAVIHIAAETSQNRTSYNDYRNINFNATVQLFHSSIRCNVKKFIFVSTANTLGYGSQETPGTEQKRIKYPFNNSFYAKSKLEAEEYLLKNKDKINVSIINPTFMLGAYDTKPSSGRIILMGWRKPAIFYPPGGKNFVHVKDVSQGIINSLKKNENKENYIIANENLSYYQFFRKLNSLTYQNPIMIKIPKYVLILLGYLGDTLRLFKIKTSLSSVNMKILCINNFYSNKKSKEKLNIKYQPIDNAIIDAVNYFKENKFN